MPDSSCSIHFGKMLAQHNIALKRSTITTLQVNIGKKCNQACHHCHVEAGPNRTENMEKNTVDRLVHLISQAPDIHTVDITGGAPEMNPHFKEFVTALRTQGKQVIDRCNLTILSEPGYEETADFLAEQGATVIASLPCYSRDNVDAQRGKGVFGKSIDGLKKLNALGYGTTLPLHLVYNPVGEILPPPQDALQADYQQRLKEDFGIVFNDLYTITNMPIHRYAHALKRDDKLESYMQLLIDNFNSDAANNVMCKELVSISWDGYIYDCDFNQMLEMPVSGQKTSIWDIESFTDIRDTIAIANHCYGCTAGKGSSCGGETI